MEHRSGAFRSGPKRNRTLLGSMMTTKTTDRRRVPHPAPMSYPHGVRPKTECLHGVATRGGQGGAVWGNLGWRFTKSRLCRFWGPSDGISEIRPHLPPPTSERTSLVGHLCRLAHVAPELPVQFGSSQTHQLFADLCIYSMSWQASTQITIRRILK